MRPTNFDAAVVLDSLWNLPAKENKENDLLVLISLTSIKRHSPGAETISPSTTRCILNQSKDAAPCLGIQRHNRNQDLTEPPPIQSDEVRNHITVYDRLEVEVDVQHTSQVVVGRLGESK